MDGTVLVADDDSTIRTVLTQALVRAGCKVHATSSLTTLMRWVCEGRGDAVITDVVMPDGNGLEMLPRIAVERPGLPVIVISAQNTIMTAIRAREAEAFDYLPKPFDLPDLMKRTARALAARGNGAAGGPGETPPAPSDELPLVGRTPVMQALYQLVAQLLNADLAVMITGESGTGKSLIAETIHARSDRRARPLLILDGASTRDSGRAREVLESVRGGTVLIEEISEIPTTVQVDLLHMIDRPGDPAPRFLATSTADPEAALDAGKLRPDLYYRLAGATLDVPPLRARAGDIGPLAAHFLDKASGAHAPPRDLSAEAMEAMRVYPWPGNVRQLENAMRRVQLGPRGLPIGKDEIDAALATQPDRTTAGAATDDEQLAASVTRHLQRYFDLHERALPPPGLHGRLLREIERPLIEIALEATGGNQLRCAELLGINRNTLRKKITDLDIRVTRRRKLM